MKKKKHFMRLQLVLTQNNINNNNINIYIRILDGLDGYIWDQLGGSRHL
jgi:hypothetical protein